VLKEVMEDVESLVKEWHEGYSGADLAALVWEAGVTTLRKALGMLAEMDDLSTTTEDREQLSVTVGVQHLV
jgi:ATP-dependent 26S proteasome regulatory subunit